LKEKDVQPARSTARLYTAAAAATSCRAVPVESKTIVSCSLVRPGLSPATI